MKKWISLVTSLVFSFILHAQEVANEAVDTEVVTDDFFSEQTKWNMVLIFSGVVLLVVLRTFRNKPEV